MLTQDLGSLGSRLITTGFSSHILTSSLVSLGLIYLFRLKGWTELSSSSNRMYNL